MASGHMELALGEAVGLTVVDIGVDMVLGSGLSASAWN